MTRAAALTNASKPIAVIREATPSDLPAIERLLTANDLPTLGVADSIDSFLVAEHEGALVGVVGIEAASHEYGLLRSTAVAPTWRNRGLGRQLVERAIAAAEARGTKALYLLTTTAEHYFPSFGFTPTARADVPEAIRTTGEFQTSCPASATVMALELKHGSER